MIGLNFEVFVSVM